jgi:hypothetical protein
MTFDHREREIIRGRERKKYQTERKERKIRFREGSE